MEREPEKKEVRCLLCNTFDLLDRSLICLVCQGRGLLDRYGNKFEEPEPISIPGFFPVVHYIKHNDYGKYHRLDGPALTVDGQGGISASSFWYIDGKKINFKESYDWFKEVANYINKEVE